MTGCHGTVGWSHDITVLRLGLQVLAQAQKELLCYQTSGISIMGKLHQTLSIYFMDMFHKNGCYSSIESYL